MNIEFDKDGTQIVDTDEMIKYISDKLILKSYSDKQMVVENVINLQDEYFRKIGIMPKKD